jgi:hypothetical protein
VADLAAAAKLEQSEMINRGLLEREWQAVKWSLFGYPQGHRYYEESPILRYYPLGCTIVFIVAPIVWGLWRWLS